MSITEADIQGVAHDGFRKSRVGTVNESRTNVTKAGQYDVARTYRCVSDDVRIIWRMDQQLLRHRIDGDLQRFASLLIRVYWSVFRWHQEGLRCV